MILGDGEEEQPLTLSTGELESVHRLQRSLGRLEFLEPEKKSQTGRRVQQATVSFDETFTTEAGRGDSLDEGEPLALSGHRVSVEVDKLELTERHEDLLDVLSDQVKVERPDVQPMVRNLGVRVSISIEGGSSSPAARESATDRKSVV